MEMVTLDSMPEMSGALRELNDATWPEFLLRADIRSWSSIYTGFQSFQILVLEQNSLVAAGLTVPFEWVPGDLLPNTIDEVVYPAHWPLRTAGVLCALGVLVRPIYRRKGLSRKILSEMRSLSKVRGLRGVLAPARPNRKHEFADESIETYVEHRDDKGRLLDPWLRVHEEMGGERLGFMHKSVTVTASIQDWEKWTGMRFSTSGSYSIPDGLAPVSIDLEKDQGTYREPNVWYFHRSNPND
ncbi:MAG: hypothetical protein OXR72_14190 [Gemmatimonadota bacterium]|nr:hypothetical protein [Gemmatimonadota bacterium]